ncbi:hypothetical protein ZIOFF_074441 (mitochondrion) [Zingiber officinale]|uniref:Uncharacterized protein n=1 Tax=Zingiber officinale TaxID=94328 RepID=A0A8J5EL44_ZINOF|nr:hypothetical protein ZIOFF_075133 [Zingiber officinale]KAG6467703.1 hypothetical protein ZIOFF_074441 [Zingiber officinale]
MVEVSNRAILHALKTKLDKESSGWDELLPEIYWAYRTTPNTTTGETPFSLVYGSEAISEAEAGMRSYRIQMYGEHENVNRRISELAEKDEMTDTVFERLLQYQL